MPEQMTRILTKPCKVVEYSLDDVELGTLVGTGMFGHVS